jgi:hypothetical protein
MTPQEATRKTCIDCLGLNQFHTALITDCQGDTALNGACPMYHKRLKGSVSVKLIRKHCLYCQGKNSDAVADCNTTSCSFYIYRLGRNPARAGMGRRDAFAR